MKYIFFTFFILFPYILFGQDFTDLKNKARDAAKNGNYELSANYLTQCISINNSDGFLYWSRGFAYSQQKKYELALPDINKAIDIYSIKNDTNLKKLFSLRGQIYKNTNNYKDAIDDYTKSITYGNLSYSIFWDRALCYFELKDYDNCLNDYLKAIELIDKSNTDGIVRLYNNIGNLYYNQLNNTDKAIESFSKSISIKPIENKSFYFRGIAYMNNINYNAAVKDFTEAMTAYKVDNKMKNWICGKRGECYIEIGEYEKGINDYFVALKDTQTANIYMRLGDAYRLMGKYQEGIDYFTKALNLSPDYWWCYYRRGWTKEFANDNNGALKDFDKAIELGSKYAYTYLSRGDLKTKLFGIEKAKTDYEMILTLENNYLKSGNCKQFALFYLGKNEEGIEWMNKTIEKFPTSHNYYDFACLYSIMNKKEDAIKYLELAFKNGYVQYIHMVHDEYLNNIKFTKEFDNLLKKYNINIEIPIPISDIDIKIPVTSLNNNKRFALIIGNEDYSSYQLELENEMNVEYARNDALAFKEYAIKTLGIPDRNITTLTNATSAQIMQGLEKLSRLAGVMSGQAELYLYYAGHGIANQLTKESYLIPVDVNGSNLQYALKLQDVYNKLTENPSKKITVFLDACFSGGARNKELLAMRGIKIKAKENELKGNFVVFASSSGTESSQSFAKNKHGLFTYFLLKKIQETKGEVTYKELYDYIKQNVSLEAILNKNQSQTPSILTSTNAANSWSEWKIN